MCVWKVKAYIFEKWNCGSDCKAQEPHKLKIYITEQKKKKKKENSPKANRIKEEKEQWERGTSWKEREQLKEK